MHQQALSDSRACLAHYEVVQPVAVKSQPSSPQADGSGRHEHDLTAVFLQGGDGWSHRREKLGIELSVAVRHNARAELDHRAACRAQPFLLFAFRMLICHGFLLYHRRALVRKLSGTGVAHIPIVRLSGAAWYASGRDALPSHSQLLL